MQDARFKEKCPKQHINENEHVPSLFIIEYLLARYLQLLMPADAGII